jgi:excisionase family DNA binding protein
MMSTRAFAARCGVVSETVRDWIAKGRLEPAGRTPGGHYRFSEEQVAAALGGELERGNQLGRDLEAHVLAARAKMRAWRTA